MTIEWLGVDGHLRWKGMVCTMPDLWQKVSAKSQVWILVVNDVTFRVVVARMLIENLKRKVVDIDNALLNGDLEQ